MSCDNSQVIAKLLSEALALEASLRQANEDPAPIMIHRAPDRDPKYYFIPKESDKRKPHKKHGSNYTPPKRRHRKSKYP